MGLEKDLAGQRVVSIFGANTHKEMDEGNRLRNFLARVARRRNFPQYEREGVSEAMDIHEVDTIRLATFQGLTERKPTWLG